MFVIQYYEIVAECGRNEIIFLNLCKIVNTLPHNTFKWIAMFFMKKLHAINTMTFRSQSKLNTLNHAFIAFEKNARSDPTGKLPTRCALALAMSVCVTFYYARYLCEPNYSSIHIINDMFMYALVSNSSRSSSGNSQPQTKCPPKWIKETKRLRLCVVCGSTAD